MSDAPKVFDTHGRDALILWLAVDGRSQTSLAKSLGLTPSSVSRWVSGFLRPEDGSLRRDIEKVTGIKTGAWKTDEEREAEKARAAKVAAAIKADALSPLASPAPEAPGEPRLAAGQR